MATKVRQNGLFPGYYSEKDVNGEANSSYPRYYQDNNFGDLLFFDSYMRRPVNGHSEYDKELLKQTMLQHEAIFQRQVYELHRIYRVQKKLMDEFKSRWTCRSSLPRGISQSNSLMPEMHFGCSQKVQQFHLLDNDVVCSKENRPAVDDLRSHFSFTKEVKLPSCPENRHLKDNELVYYKAWSCPRRMFEHLPAGALEKNSVLDSSCRSATQINGIQDNNVQLALGIGGSSICREDNGLACSRALNNTYGHSKACPNEISTSMDYERSTISASQVDSDSGPTNGEIKHEWEFLTGDSVKFYGKSRCNLRFFSKNLGKDKMLSESVRFNLKICPELMSSDNKNPAECFGRDFNNIGSSTQTLHRIVADSSGFVSRSITSPSNVSWCEPLHSLHLLGSSQSKAETRISHVSVQGASVFNVISNFSIQSSNVTKNLENSTTSEKGQNSGKVNSGLGASTVPASYPNDFYHDLSSDSVSGHHLQVVHCKSKADYRDSSDDINVKSHISRKNFKGFQSRIEKTVQEINLNPTCLSGNHDELITFHVEEMKYNELPDSLARVNSYSNKVGSSNASKVASTYINEYSKLIASPSSIVSELKDNKDIRVSPCNLQDIQPRLQDKCHSLARTEAYDHSGKTTIGFPFFDRVHQSGKKFSSFIPHQEQSLNDGTKSPVTNGSFCNDLSFGTNSASSKKRMDACRLITKRHVQNSSTNIVNAIDLNKEPSCTDDAMLLEILPEDEDRIPPSCSLPSLDAIYAYDVPPEGSPSQDGSCTRTHDDLNITSRNGCPQDEECSFDPHVRLAAESIVAMSKDKSCHARQSFPLRYDTLRWFAEVVSSNSENAILRVGDICNQSSDDGLDLFEAMTLELRETTANHFLCSPNEFDTIEAKQEDDRIASLLVTKPPRGQTRRKQPRKNLSKDVFPGLASLSRHEITKDLHAAGRLKKVSGRSTNGGVNSEAKVRRKPRSSVAAVHDISALSSHQPAQQSRDEFHGIEKTVVGWGRTTRRCRGNRSFPGYVCASLAQE